MKQLILPSLLILLASQSFAQSKTGLQSAAPNQWIENNDKPAILHTTASENKALLSFKKEYPSATEEKWSKTKDGSRVKFNANGKLIIENFNRRGKWTSTITYLSMNQVPEEIRSTIHEMYSTYTMFFAQEVKTYLGSVHIVKIEDKTTWKTLKVYNNQVEIMEDNEKI